MTSNPHGLDVLGYTRATMAATTGSHPARGRESLKRGRSSDCRLQPACMKPELLVIADQHAAVNPFPGLVHTARHTMGAGHARSRYPNRKEGDAEGRASDWSEVVTR